MKSACPYDVDLGARVMTNFDHTIEEDVEKTLKATRAWSGYPGWNFHGRVWWDVPSSTWSCEVWQFGTPMKVFHASTLKEIMENVSEEFGYD